MSRRKSYIPLNILLLATIAATPAAPMALAAPLDFEARAECHRAIEEVYWQHRTWPAANPGPKPPLAAVLPEETLRARAGDALGLSAALAERWGAPITPAMLQAELDRMARSSRDPARLAELFAALGDDPARIAECLVRPALADRLARHRYGFDAELHADLERRARHQLAGAAGPDALRATADVWEETEWLRAGDGAAAEAAADPALVTLDSDAWSRALARLAETLGAPGAIPAAGRVGPLREDETGFSAVVVLAAEPDRLRLGIATWPKTPFENWWSAERDRFAAAPAGAPPSAFTLPVVTGTVTGGAGCDVDTWTTTPMVPTERSEHTAVWTGSEMIVFGGRFDRGNDIGAYDPAIDHWRPLPLDRRPNPRRDHTAVWTGREMVIWAGWLGDSPELVTRSGGRYDPATDEWTHMSTSGAPQARMKHTAVWTGSEMVVWGGCETSACSDNLDTGGRYDPETNSWAPVALSGSPPGRADHTAVWSGDEVILWGGCSGTFCESLIDNGGRYDPALDTWAPVNTVSAPPGRRFHTAVWTGSRMVVWGGCTDDSCASPTSAGGRYDPATDSWDPTTPSDAPAGRRFHSAVWTGDEMIVWGGCVDADCSDHRGTGGRYDPAVDLWMPTAAGAPAARSRHTAVWTGAEMVVWGGCSSGECQVDRDDGARYSPAADAWTPTNDPQTPSRRWGHTAVWTGSEMIVWGGRDPLGAVLTGGRYDPATDAWTATAVDGSAEARDLHTAVWTGTEMITWGGRVSGTGPSSSGNRYDPTAESWTETATAGAPAPRYGQGVVWTGSEMIVWGGEDATGGVLATGGRYDPATDSWLPTATTGAPVGRSRHTEVWTGSEMIVWGGVGEVASNLERSGGRYDPAADAWTPTTLEGAPSARVDHTAVWTGERMAVWGGGGGSVGPDLQPLRSGGLYDPATDAWTPTTLEGAPTSRFGHAAAWTGAEMIVWSGCEIFDCRLSHRSGARYDPDADLWTDTATAFAPPGRGYPTGVWTGERMIVWGGYLGPGTVQTATGGLYCAGGPLVFADGFESGDTSAWSGTVELR